MSSTATARVVAAHGRRGRLETGDGATRPYVVRGRRLKVVCGDRVRWTPSPHGEQVTVTAVEQRRNSLARLDPRRGATEILAANLDLLAVVVAPLPEPDWFLVDRYLCAAALMAADGLLVGNKLDQLAGEDTAFAADLDEYRAIGYPVLLSSAATGTGIAELGEALAGRTALLVGQSGVGKSSLINRLVPDAALATAGLSRSKAEGRHTTTASIMHRLPGGGRLIDSPGVRDFLPAIPGDAAVQAGFPEIDRRAGSCRFADCRHLREPGCAVKAAVAAGEIQPRRYESYRRLLRSVAPRRSG